MTKQEAKQRLANRINKYTATEIKKIILDMAKPMREYTEEEKIVRAFLFDAYENKTSEDRVDQLLDYVEAIEWPA